MGISYHSYIGKTVDQLPALPCSTSGHLSLNTPVGSCVDNYGRIWLADTAHNRILVFDAAMGQILACFGTVGALPGQFNMPFRLLAHPEKNRVYVTDIGNCRVHILEYTEQLDIQSIKVFGDEPEVALKGPNGIVIYNGKVCVADEFYEGPSSQSRLVIFSEEGKFERAIEEIIPDNEGDPVHLLWPQGLSLDNSGNIYIANTGFATVVRCDWQGRGITFKASGKCYIDGLALSRGVSVIQNRILIPGGEANAIAVYDLQGQFMGRLEGFFAPVQVTAASEPNTLLITEPFLASLQKHTVNLSTLKGGKSRATKVLKAVGDERDNPGQLHFVTSVVGDVTNTQSGYSSNAPIFEHWVDHQLALQEQLFKVMQPPGLPSWLSIALSAQTEWVQRWQQTMVRIFLNDKFDDPEDLLWMMDSGNYQLQASEDGKSDSARPISLPMLPGSLGIAALTPANSLPGQLDPQVPLLVVSNYLSGIVTVLQYNDTLGEMVPYTVFGGLGTSDEQLNKPQGIAVDPTNNDILIADSGNNRICRWRLSEAGRPFLVHTFGRLGSEHGEFHTPSDITVDARGTCFITDQNNNRIEVYDQLGQWVRSIGQEGYGTDSSNFLLPTSIDHENGYLFVSDLVNRAIKVFTCSGEYLESFSGFGADTEQGQLWLPYLLHVKNSKVYLPDCALNRVNIYQFNI
ncbi:NHL repeat-containing protein [Pseudoalteromonas sp. SMS1]|uniref:NHL repeat-containing protein n=1 Tax=Pseudoalteromonas sp. SMS1 TaxID=2908894 RepID=UPI001F256590|nr:NHL repeat-containing protein [Pseudoalteromonas sp. SMS1]MCF2856663.1 NHL repeat-containing protein [Pseudoalteromonas sp. SMS1]